MEASLFYLVSALALICALCVVLKRNPVVSALFLVATLFLVAILYVLLHAQFIAALQVIVYAGAIMVLFIFVIMLLNLQEERRSSGGHTLQRICGVALGFSLLYNVGSAVSRGPLRGMMGAYPAAQVEAEGHTRVLAKLLFTDFLLPFEITSVLLLVAIIGAVVLAKKRV
jgi:NADH-quinone oxidoreductase subunit J